MSTYYHVINDLVYNIIEVDPSVVDTLDLHGDLFPPVDDRFVSDIGARWSVEVSQHEANVALTDQRFAELDEAIDLAFSTDIPDNPVSTPHGSRSIDD
jgi:hypothetical protein